MLNDNDSYKELQAAFQLQIKKRSDKLIDFFLTCFFISGLVFTWFYDTWLIAITVGGLSLIAYYSVKIALPGSELYKYVLSVVFAIFMAQFIYQMHGMFEMHFFAFIGSVILITYQDWKLQIPMLLVVIIHHIIFGYLQNNGVENIYFTELGAFGLRSFIIHFLLAGVIFFVCGLWAYHLRNSSEMQIRQTIELGNLQKEAFITLSMQIQHAELIKAQHAIAESNKRFEYAAQATSDAIWDRVYTENVINWGEGFSTLFGYDINEETTSIDFWQSRVHPEDLETIADIINSAKSNPAVNTWTGEYRFQKANGDFAFVREKAIILRDETGKAAKTIGAVQDITEIRQNEAILKKLNENLEREKYFLDSLMDNMPDSIYFKDRESKIIRVSKYMADRFASNVNDLIGKCDFDFQGESHAAEAYRDEQNIVKTGIPKIDYLEKEALKDGSECWVSTTKMPLINAHNEIVGTFGISRDVTKVQLLEAERHEALMDKAVAQGKFEIASDVMHDIGNAVVGFGSYMSRIRRLQAEDNPDTLKSLSVLFEKEKTRIGAAIGEQKADALIKMFDSMSKKQRSSQEEINKSMAEQENIISNIQEILNIQRQHIKGHESKERQPVDVRNIIDDSFSMLSAFLDKSGISIKLNVAPELPSIKGDRTRLVQALLSVLRNSIEEIDSNATEKSIHINAFAKADRLVLEVKDSGNGFAGETGARFFSKGFTTKFSASGSGLYSCRQIIESHGGTIDINSPGQGMGSVATMEFKIN